MSEHDDAATHALNWPAVAALYIALCAGIAGMLYWGDYRNAAWLALIGTGGALTAVGRVLEERGKEGQAQRWQWAAGAAYAVFFVWAGSVLVRYWVG